MTNGGEGFIGEEEYLMLWSVEELPSLNEAYEVQQYAPGLLLFGSSGGGEAYGFDTRNQRFEILRVPFIGMAWDLAQPIANSFDLFMRTLYSGSK